MPIRYGAKRQYKKGLLTWMRGLFIVAAGMLVLAACSQNIKPHTPTPFREPLVPTPLSTTATSTANPTEDRLPTSTDIRTPDLPAPYTLRWHAGVGVPEGQSPLIYRWPDPRPGWYLNWSVGFTETAWISDTVGSGLTFNIPSDVQAGMEFAPVVRTPQGELVPGIEWISAVAAQLPGKTWLIGNEPDVQWQDNATPEQYARAYQQAYAAIKKADPTAQIAIGGISQITPLRLAYLERVWDSYRELYGEEMPVDVWTMHAFVLQEKAGEWGVGMPPGFGDVSEGELWAIEEHNDLALIEEQVRRMRGWMKEHNQQEKPLWITEYGILMPTSYGFDAGVVRRFLLGSYDLFRFMIDPDLGYAADGNRLVQRWVWFSTGYDLYSTGDLFTRAGQPTGFMHALSAYLAEYDSHLE